MSTDRQTRGDDRIAPDEQLALPQDDFTEEPLAAELEPQADGTKRVILYPHDADGHEIATRWLAISADAVVSLADVR